MATQSIIKAGTSMVIESQATDWQYPIDDPNNNTDNSTFNAINDIILQTIYSSIGTLENTADVDIILDMGNDAAQEAMPVDFTSAKIHSAALNGEQTSDTPIDDASSIDTAYDGTAIPDTISGVESNETDAPIDDSDSGSDLAIITTDETVVVNEEPDFISYVSEWYAYTTSDSFAIASTAKIHSPALNGEQTSDTPIDYASSIDTAYDGAAIPDVISGVESNETDAPIDDSDSGSDLAIITTDETVVVNEEPDFISYVSGWYAYTPSDSFAIASINYMATAEISFELYVEENATLIGIEDTVDVTSTDNTLTDDVNFSDQPVVDYVTLVDDGITIDVTEEEIVKDNAIPADIEEAADDLIDDSMEEPVEGYEILNDGVVGEDNYIPDESIDNNTDPLAEVTDEPFIIYSSVFSWTTGYSISLVNLSISAMDDSLNSFWTADETPIDAQTEVASDDSMITLIGLPASTDWIA